MITKAGIAVLDTMSTVREATPAELATATGYSKSHLYDVLDQLISSGLLSERRGSDNQRLVRAANTPVTEAYRELQAEVGHVDWPELLTPGTLRVVWYLDEPTDVASIADRLDITRQGIHKALAPLKNRSMLRHSGAKYALTDGLSPLLSFVQAVVRHKHRSIARQTAPSATVEWCDPVRALVRVQAREDTDRMEKDPDWELTGLARFEEYGLQFFLANEPAFWYTPDQNVSADEIVCHTLTLDSGPRRVSYSMLLIDSANLSQETLMNEAKWYDLEEVVNALYRGLEGGLQTAENSPVTVPTESEYSTLKENYGVV